MIKSLPIVGAWIKLKLKEKDSSNKNEWRGFTESVDDTGVTISNGESAVGGLHQAVFVEWSKIDGYTYFDKEEVSDYYFD